MAREVTIKPCEDAYRIARDLISQYHPHLAEEGDVLLSCVTTTARRTSGGQEVYASTIKASDLVRFFAPLSEKAGRKPDFVILISESAWAFADARERAAMIDHCLCCITARDGKRGRTYKLVGPDVHEFASVIERHGLWHLQLKLMGRATQGRQAQMDLGLIPQEPDGKVAARSAEGTPLTDLPIARAIFAAGGSESHESAPERAEPFPDTPEAEERREAALARLESTARAGR